MRLIINKATTKRYALLMKVLKKLRSTVKKYLNFLLSNLANM